MIPARPRTLTGAIIALAVIAPFVSGWQEPPEEPACSCATARLLHRWCEACDVGYLAGVKVPSRDLFEVLDASGHRIDPARIKCQGCQQEMKRNGYCEKSRMGFVGRRAFLSRLSHTVALGKRQDLSLVDCKKCREHTRKWGWCQVCAVGRAGAMRFSGRDIYLCLAQELRLLERAIAHLKPCGLCGIAKFTGGRCPKCRIDYPACDCATLRDSSGWCPRCEVGWLKDRRIPSRPLHTRARTLLEASPETGAARLEKALDRLLACEGCAVQALEDDRRCPRCRPKEKD